MTYVWVIEALPASFWTYHRTGTHLRTWTGIQEINGHSSLTCHSHSLKARISINSLSRDVLWLSIILSLRTGVTVNAKLEEDTRSSFEFRRFARAAIEYRNADTTWSVARIPQRTYERARFTYEPATIALEGRATNDVTELHLRRTTGASVAQACDPRGRSARDPLAKLFNFCKWKKETYRSSILQYVYAQYVFL